MTYSRYVVLIILIIGNYTRADDSARSLIKRIPTGAPYASDAVECKSLGDDWNRFAQNVNVVHQNCLDSKTGTSKPGIQCSMMQCESLHMLMTELNSGSLRLKREYQLSACQKGVSNAQHQNGNQKSVATGDAKRKQSEKAVPRQNYEASIGHNYDRIRQRHSGTSREATASAFKEINDQFSRQLSVTVAKFREEDKQIYATLTPAQRQWRNESKQDLETYKTALRNAEWRGDQADIGNLILHAIGLIRRSWTEPAKIIFDSKDNPDYLATIDSNPEAATAAQEQIQIERSLISDIPDRSEFSVWIKQEAGRQRLQEAK